MKVEEAFAAYWALVKERHIFTPAELFAAVEPAFAENGFRVEGEARSILLVRLDAIGDMVMTSGFIRELRRNYPQARIDAVVRKIQDGETMRRLFPWLAEENDGEAGV